MNETFDVIKCNDCGMFKVKTDDSCQYCIAGSTLALDKGYTPPKGGIPKEQRRKQVRQEHSADKCSGKCPVHAKMLKGR